MTFVADLHIHSKFSRATAKNLDFENLYIAAQIKGITVVGTGDFTHPGWFEEITTKLELAEEGLFQLKPEIAKACDERVPPICRQPVRFLLVSEISNIYKKNDRTRKNHNLVFMPNLEAAQTFNRRLGQLGNITSDGRPILGLDARNLLELTLETAETAYLIPAHIWTPWFSLLGSKSGFDSIKECFEDLSEHIFAVETGLSSDPPMNRRLSALDDLTLVSNSDAHSPMKLGREANLFHTALTYPAIRRALVSGDPNEFLGTYEFYPEEGKYHLDGHRKCQFRCTPETSKAHNGKCPHCGKALTLGVLYRVEQLADRTEGLNTALKHPFHSLIPLDDILAELCKVGPQSKKVKQHYQAAIEKLGSEFHILHTLPIDQIEQAGPPLLSEAIARVRNQKVHIAPGYDGEFGTIKIFDEAERQDLLGQKLMFAIPPATPALAAKPAPPPPKKRRKLSAKKPPAAPQVSKRIDSYESAIIHLNEEQAQAVHHGNGPLLIVAGPGTGKTRTLTLRIAHLIRTAAVPAERILAVTFTNKAAQEMRLRLQGFLPPTAKPPLVATFHALCLHLLKEIEHNERLSLIDDSTRRIFMAEAIRQAEQTAEGPSTIATDAAMQRISAAKQAILKPTDPLSAYGESQDVPPLADVYRHYQELMEIQQCMDYDDLIFKMVQYVENDPALLRKYQTRFTHVFIDEYQDLNEGQYRITRALAPAENPLCVIGDPNQSIYGFRGSNVFYFKQFINDYPSARVIALHRNYRSIETILKASHQLIQNYSLSPSAQRVTSGIHGAATISVHAQGSEKSEAVFVGRTIESLVGGMGFYSIDFNKTEAPFRSEENAASNEYGFSDIAVLYRTNQQGKVFANIFNEAGIPCQMVTKANRFDRKGLMELLALLRICSEGGSLVDLERVMDYMPNGIGRKSLDRMKTWCYQNRYDLCQALHHLTRCPIPAVSSTQQSKLAKFIATLTQLAQVVRPKPLFEQLTLLTHELPPLSAELKKDAQLKALHDELLHLAQATSASPFEFLATLALQTEPDGYDFQSESVSLMTMHAAKGLEFPIVFIVGCEEGFHPYGKFEGKTVDEEEERRLLYVAMTRAKSRLFITHVNKRSVRGKLEPRALSPFLTDIDQQLLQHARWETQSRSPNPHKQLELF